LEDNGFIVISGSPVKFWNISKFESISKSKDLSVSFLVNL